MRIFETPLPPQSGLGRVIFGVLVAVLATAALLAWSPAYDEVPPNPQLRALVPDFRPAFTSDNFLVMLQAAE
jgi:hypothetical protein